MGGRKTPCQKPVRFAYSRFNALPSCDGRTDAQTHDDGVTRHYPQQNSCPWVGLTHGLGWLGSGWVEIFQFLVGWVGLGPLQQKYCVNAFKARLDKIWLHQAVKFVSFIGLGG